jgi:DNA-binding winged helix-turn-helix (wHTH) protein
MSDRAGYAFGEFVLDTVQARLLRREGAPVELTPRLFAALLGLVERAGELVDRETLHDPIWPGLVVGDNGARQARRPSISSRREPGSG